VPHSRQLNLNRKEATVVVRGDTYQGNCPGTCLRVPEKWSCRDSNPPPYLNKIKAFSLLLMITHRITHQFFCFALILQCCNTNLQKSENFGI